MDPLGIQLPVFCCSTHDLDYDSVPRTVGKGSSRFKSSLCSRSAAAGSSLKSGDYAELERIWCAHTVDTTYARRVSSLSSRCSQAALGESLPRRTQSCDRRKACSHRRALRRTGDHRNLGAKKRG